MPASNSAAPFTHHLKNLTLLDRQRTSMSRSPNSTANLTHESSELLPSHRRILTIDDNPDILSDYRKVLLQGAVDDEFAAIEASLFGEPTKRFIPGVKYHIDSASQGQLGFEMVKEAIKSDQPYSCAFIDIRMPPGWDGIETVQRIWEIDPDLPVVLCTAYSDHSWEEISIRLSRTDQLLFLKKPFDSIELRQVAAAQTSRWCLARIANRKKEELEAMVRERTKEILKTRDLVFYTLARLAESRDPETGEHLERIQSYARLLLKDLAENSCYASQLDNDFIDEVCRSSVLHDIGKVGIPDHILLKPGRLTPDEFEIMKTHAQIGADALEDAAKYSSCCGFLKIAAEIARYHHEKYDGSGYPEGRVAQNIPLSARIIAVVDVFDALTTERVYKQAMAAEDARQLILSESGRHFDPVIVDAFERQWNNFATLAAQLNPSDSDLELADVLRN